MRKTILLSLSLFPALALASGYSLPNVNPRDVAMSASAGAAQIDAGAVFATPAALARLSGPSAKLGLGAFTISETWNDTTSPTTTDISRQFTPLPVGYLSYSGKLPVLGERRWGIGAAFSPFGGGVVKWPSDWTGRYRITEVDRKVFDTLVTAGVEVLPMLRIGGGVIYTYTTEKLRQKTYLGFLGPLPDATATLDLSGGAVSYDVSAELDPVPQVPLRIAVDYKHKATQDLSGTVKWSGLPAGASTINPVLQDQDAKETLVIPNRLNVALAYQVVKPLLVTFAWTLDRWVVYDRDHFVGSVAGPDHPIDVPRNYRNGYTLRGGVEYDLLRALQLRVGVQRDHSGLRTDTYSPTLPDASSWAVSGGATVRMGHGLSVDAGIFYALMDKVTAEPPAGSVDPPPYPVPTGTFRGSYDISAVVFGAAIGWTPHML